MVYSFYGSASFDKKDILRCVPLTLCGTIEHIGDISNYQWELIIHFKNGDLYVIIFDNYKSALNYINEYLPEYNLGYKGNYDTKFL